MDKAAITPDNTIRAVMAAIDKARVDLRRNVPLDEDKPNCLMLTAAGEIRSPASLPGFWLMSSTVTSVRSPRLAIMA